ncbi:MAG TPA: ATP-binding protein, partial [Streptosporangiaceae bacterium]|nr:ATP-binding protein [Streptosporangiaceae bacterium]
VLETSREMLETLAGPVLVSEGLVIAVQSLRRGLQADEVALITQSPGKLARWRAFAGPLGTDTSAVSASMSGLAETALSSTHPDGVARQLHSGRGQRVRAVAFVAAGGPTVLLASWRRVPPTKEETALLEDAAHSLRLALEREEAGHAHQEAAALRRSRELQRGFLSRLSHELRTPLTAIRGYASSLLQPDVTWDRESQQRFLDRIAAESARLGRLVDDLLDFSAIESGIMRLQWDWCDIRLVVEAAIACLPPGSAASVSLTCDPSLPVVWADHDRLEQVFVNLLNNAFGHNPPGTAVRVTATAEQITAGQPGEPEQPGRHPVSEVVISVLDDGVGMPPELMPSPFEAARRPSPASGNGHGTGRGNGSGHTSGNGSGAGGNGREGGRRNAGAGLGLSIAKGIVQAHGGRIELVPRRKGTCFRVHLPVEAEIMDGGRTAGSFRGITAGDDAADVPAGRAMGRGGQAAGRDGSDTDDD